MTKSESTSFLHLYTVEMERPIGKPPGTVIKYPMCSICADTGFIHLPERKTPWGKKVPPLITYCACPNGLDSRTRQAPLPTA